MAKKRMSSTSSFFIQILSLIAILLLTQEQSQVQAKIVQCKNRFNKKQISDYCTKFGTESNSKLKVEVRSRIINIPQLSDSSSQQPEGAQFEIAVYADQEYDKLQAQKNPSCEDRRKAATVLMPTVLDKNGSWSDKFNAEGNKISTDILTQRRPRMYYFEVLDCKGKVQGSFSSGGIPRVIHEIHMTTDDGKNEFSYEDQGTLRLYVFLMLILGSLFVLIVRTFIKYLAQENKWSSPHPIMIVSLGLQVLYITLQMLHLWGYSYQGEGYVVLDVLSKIFQGFSEVAMSLLLILLASGWKLRYEDMNFDNNEDFYIPFGAITFIVHIVLAALTFVDMDASHKYHDFAGVQGWCLFVLKSLLFGYFYWCIYDSQEQCKKKKDQLVYLQSLLILGAAYLLAIPNSVLITFMFEPYERQYVYTFISEMQMFVANSVLLYLLASSKSSYRKTSTDDATLPSNM